LVSDCDTFNIVDCLMNKETQIPVFIVGCYRSGTTLVRVMLSSHSKVYICEETGYIPLIFEKIDKYGDLNRDDNLITLIKDINKYLLNTGWRRVPRPEDCIAEIKERTFEEIVRYVALYNAPQSVKIWGDNTPVYVNSFFTLSTLFPDAKFINVVRDGRDVAASAKRLHIGGFNVTTLAMEWNERISNGLLAQHILGCDKVMTIRYEDLVSNPKVELTKICSFLGLKFENEMLNYYRKNFSIEMKKHAHHVNLSVPLTSKFVGRYKRTFSAKDIMKLERLMQNGLLAYGYDLNYERLAPLSNFVRYKDLSLNFLLFAYNRLRGRGLFRNVRLWSRES